MTTTVYTTKASTSWHTDRDCDALDTEQLHTRGLVTEREYDPKHPDDLGRTPCVVCAGDPNATEWTLTPANLGQLWELIGPSKPHHVTAPDGGGTVVDGLTVFEPGLPRVLARFGDTLRRTASGRYTVHCATPAEES